MRLLQFVEISGRLCPPYHRIKCSIGALCGDNEDSIINLSKACELEKHGVSDIVDLLSKGPELLNQVKQSVSLKSPVVKRSDVRILPPITSPDKILCVGMNYVDHCLEQNQPIPTTPVIFNKFPPSLIGPEDNLPYPATTEQLDWEAEMAFVIGKTIHVGSNPDFDTIHEAIFGYTTVQDITARDMQVPSRNMGQWQMGKALDNFCPMSSTILTSDELPDDFASKVPAFKIRCTVNGVAKQESDLAQLIFKPVDIVKYLTKFWTLLPGDIILTGTPPGVGIFRKPPEFLKKGDVIQTTIENIGSFSTKIV